MFDLIEREQHPPASELAGGVGLVARAADLRQQPAHDGCGGGLCLRGRVDVDAAGRAHELGGVEVRVFGGREGVLA